MVAPVNSRDDADFWQLTTRERIRFHGRISDYYGRMASAAMRQSDYYGRRARRLGRISVCLWIVSAALAVLSFVARIEGW